MSIQVGDRVEVGSLWDLRPGKRRQGRRAIGVVEEIDPSGVRVRFDHRINGVENCHAAHNELTKLYN